MQKTVFLEFESCTAHQRKTLKLQWLQGFLHIGLCAVQTAEKQGQGATKPGETFAQRLIALKREKTEMEMGQMRRKTTWMLGLVMALAVMSGSAFAAGTEQLDGDVWDGSLTAPSKTLQKDGTYYYAISTCAELAYVAQNGGDWLGYNYMLTNNLILNDVTITWDDEGNCTNADALREWPQSGTYEGIIDGNGFTISGVYVQSQESTVGLFTTMNNTIRNLTVRNSYICGKKLAGGITGQMGHSINALIENCSFDGIVTGASAGGICGEMSGTVKNCQNYGTVRAKGSAGGIACYIYNYEEGIRRCDNYGPVSGYGKTGGIVGDTNTTGAVGCRNYARVTSETGPVGGIFGYGSAWNCVNYGEISGTSYTGGIAGSIRYVTGCINFGSVSGTEYVGGIGGGAPEWYASVETSANFGAVTGESNVGGISGNFKGNDSYRAESACCDSFNLGTVKGSSNVGGISGNIVYSDIKNVYSAGIVTGTDSVGALIGKSDCMWGRSTVKGSYYLSGDLAGVTGLSDGDGTFEAKSDAELRVQGTYSGWDWNSKWALDEEKNGSYPYLQSAADMLEEVPILGITISRDSLALPQGDVAFLSAAVTPANAGNTALRWESRNPAVANVSQGGMVTAEATGTAVITVTSGDGKHTASCTVTVTARQAEEYRLNSITIQDSSGSPLTSFPRGSFFASLSLTNLASDGSTMVLVASYTASGQFKDMMCVSVESLPIGATIRVSLLVDNSDGQIAALKAFPVASFANMQPIGNVMCFPES